MITTDALDLKLIRIGENNLHKIEHTYICPFCTDKEGKLGVNIKLNVFHCFKCDESGSISRLYNLLDIDEDEGSMCLYYDKVVIDYCTPNFIGPDDESSIGFFDSVPIDISVDSMALRYLRSRKISDTNIEKHDMRWGRNKYAGRIIIPTYEDGELVYFVARSYSGRLPKYKNPPLKKNFIFNLDTIRDSSNIIITEGVFSAIASGSTGVAIFGKHLSADQFDKICAKSFNEVIIALDNGAEYYSAILASMFHYVGFPTKIINFSKSEDDPDTAGKTRIDQLIKNAVLYKSLDYMYSAIDNLNNFYNADCKYVLNSDVNF